MPLTALDPVPALLVVDLQNGLLRAPTVHPLDEIIDRSRQLADAFRELGLPVVLIGVEGNSPGRTDSGQRAPSSRPPGFAKPAPGLGTHPGDHHLVKNVWGAFHGTSLDALLRKAGVTQVVLTGVATSIGVDSTARHAHEHGYHVVLATDAMTDLDQQAHDNAIERIFPRLGETAETKDILDLIRASR